MRVPFKSGNINWTVAEYSNPQIILSFYADLDILGTVINERFVVFLLRRSSSESEIEEIGTFSLSLRRTFIFK